MPTLQIETDVRDTRLRSISLESTLGRRQMAEDLASDLAREIFAGVVPPLSDDVVREWPEAAALVNQRIASKRAELTGTIEQRLWTLLHEFKRREWLRHDVAERALEIWVRQTVSIWFHSCGKRRGEGGGIRFSDAPSGAGKGARNVCADSMVP